MPSRSDKGDVGPTAKSAKPDIVPVDFPSEFGGEFQSLSTQLCANLGTICGLATSGGGYFGFSVTDDGGSVRLAVRHGALQFDKRFYSLAKLEGASAWLAARLAEVG